MKSNYIKFSNFAEDIALCITTVQNTTEEQKHIDHMTKTEAFKDGMCRGLAISLVLANPNRDHIIEKAMKLIESVDQCHPELSPASTAPGVSPPKASSPRDGSS